MPLWLRRQNILWDTVIQVLCLYKDISYSYSLWISLLTLKNKGSFFGIDDSMKNLKHSLNRSIPQKCLYNGKTFFTLRTVHSKVLWRTQNGSSTAKKKPFWNFCLKECSLLKYCSHQEYHGSFRIWLMKKSSNGSSKGTLWKPPFGNLYF